MDLDAVLADYDEGCERGVVRMSGLYEWPGDVPLWGAVGIVLAYTPPRAWAVEGMCVPPAYERGGSC